MLGAYRGGKGEKRGLFDEKSPFFTAKNPWSSSRIERDLNSQSRITYPLVWSN